MNLNSLSGLSGQNQASQLQRTTSKLQAAIASLASGVRTQKAADDVASLTIATQLQTQVSSLKQASIGLAQASSLTQVADGGIEQIQQRLTELKSLATQANSPVLNDANRQALNQQFKQIVSDIDRIAKTTSFNGQKLLDGSISGDKALSIDQLLSGSKASDDEGALSIDSLTASDLFGGADLNLLSAGNASQASDAIGKALDKATSVRVSVGAFQKSVDYAAASIDSAVANQEAAASILQDTDFAETSTQSSLLNLQRNATLALAAQGNRLNPVLLQLIG